MTSPYAGRLDPATCAALVARLRNLCVLSNGAQPALGSTWWGIQEAARLIERWAKEQAPATGAQQQEA